MLTHDHGGRSSIHPYRALIKGKDSKIETISFNVCVPVEANPSTTDVVQYKAMTQIDAGRLFSHSLPHCSRMDPMFAQGEHCQFLSRHFF